MSNRGGAILPDRARIPTRQRIRLPHPRRRRSGRPSLIELLERPRFEVLPLRGVEEAVIGRLSESATITVTASPRQGIAATVDLAIRLAGHGLHAVPHLSARLVRDEAQLKSIMKELTAAGIGEVFVIGGDPEVPVGAFSSSLELLQAMHDIGHQFRVGVAGYPETHPKIIDDITVQSMWDKRMLASYVVSQLCFDPHVLSDWVRRVRRRGITLPIHIGIAGPANGARLLRVGGRIGVGTSTRLLGRHAGLIRAAGPGGWRPDKLIMELAPLCADPDAGIAGLHIYTFNAVGEAEQWRRQLLQRLTAQRTIGDDLQ